MTSAAKACTMRQALLGEGLRWDARRAELLGLDILAGRVYRGRVDAVGGLSLVRGYQVPGTVGAIAPVQGDEGWLLAAGRDFVHLSSDGALSHLAQVAPARTRMNDGACDPRGRFWAGTLADDFRPGGGSLYRLSGDGRIETMLRDLTISNGLGWSPDGATMYLVDSGPRTIHAFGFDAEDGTICDGRVLVTITGEVGAPDGLTVDAEGDLWVAIYGADGSSAIPPTVYYGRPCWCRPCRAPRARSPVLGCTASTSPPPLKAGATTTVARSPRPGSCTDSTPTQPVGLLSRTGQTRPGGPK